MSPWATASVVSLLTSRRERVDTGALTSPNGCSPRGIVPAATAAATSARFLARTCAGSCAESNAVWACAPTARALSSASTGRDEWILRMIEKSKGCALLDRGSLEAGARGCADRRGVDAGNRTDRRSGVVLKRQ